MQMFPYGACPLVILLIVFFVLCPFILLLIPVVEGVKLAFKTTKADCCFKCNDLRTTNPITYFVCIFPLQIIYAVLLALILGTVGAIIGAIAAVLLTIPVWIFIIFYTCKLACVNCKVVH